jgi:hypothetical protein
MNIKKNSILDLVVSNGDSNVTYNNALIISSGDMISFITPDSYLEYKVKSPNPLKSLKSTHLIFSFKKDNVLCFEEKHSTNFLFHYVGQESIHTRNFYDAKFKSREDKKNIL